jgi:hypothetical protein
MISSRFVPAVLLLVTLALVPTVIHSYIGDVAVDGRTTRSIPAELAGYVSTPSARNEGWGRQRFDSHDWMEREYARTGDRVRLTVIRSYDLKALYHHPELAVAYGPTFGSSFGRHEVYFFRARPDIPVHVLHPAEGRRAIALYVLHYDGEFIAAPLWTQVRVAGSLLVSPRKAMTLFFAHELDAPAATPLDDLPAAGLLFGSIDSFLAGPPQG